MLMTTDCTAQLAEIEIAPLKTKFAVLDRIDAAWALASRGFGMFLAGIDQRAGLESNSHTHILKRFPAQARAEVCKQIVTFLAEIPPGTRVFGETLPLDLAPRLVRRLGLGRTAVCSW